MSNKIYFYKDVTSGKWVVDNNVVSPQDYVIKFTDYDIEFSAIGNLFYPKGKYAYTDLLKSNGVAYADKAEFDSAASDFFKASSSGGADTKSFVSQWLRNSDVITYTAGDIIGSTTGVVQEIHNVAKGAGKGVKITSVNIQTADTGVLYGTKLKVIFYSAPPTTTGLTDNGQFTYNYINAPVQKGNFSLVMNAQVGQNDFSQVILNPTGTSIYYILVDETGHTPIASAGYTITIGTELSNN